MADLQVRKLRHVSDVAVHATPVTIGRSSDNVIVLPSPAVSRHHCVIERVHGVVRLRDLDSRHGTRVNDRAVTQVELSDGDCIRVARFEITFVDPDARGDGASDASTEFDLGEDADDPNEDDDDAVAAIERRLVAAEQECALAARDAEVARATAARQQAELVELRAETERLHADLARTARAAAQAKAQAVAAERSAARMRSASAPLRSAAERLGGIQEDLRELETQWLETDERMLDAEEDGRQPPDALRRERERIAHQLELAQADHDDVVRVVQTLLNELGHRHGADESAARVRGAGEREGTSSPQWWARKDDATER